MKTEFVREYKRRIRLILISKLNRKNKKIKAINSWVVATQRYGVVELAWRVDELGGGDFKQDVLVGETYFWNFSGGGGGGGGKKKKKKAGFNVLG